MSVVVVATEVLSVVSAGTVMYSLTTPRSSCCASTRESSVKYIEASDRENGVDRRKGSEPMARVGKLTERLGSDCVNEGSEAMVPGAGPCRGPSPSGSRMLSVASRSSRRSNTM